MPNITTVRQSNALLTPTTIPKTAVFVGGTAGIGKLTLSALAELGFNFKAYVIGRKGSEASFKTHAESLRSKNAHAELIWIEGEVSLLSEAQRICDHITTLETSIDLLFMTTGYAPMGGRNTEGLDTSHSLEFYTRICFVENLLPCLRASGRARDVTVQSGGMEIARLLDVDDLNLEKPGAFGFMATQLHMGMMNTLTLERISEKPENESIVFIHSHPGIVRTGNLFRGWKEGSWGPWLCAILLDPILMLIAISFEESGQRYLYQVTSGVFGGNGPKPDGILAGRMTRGKKKGGLFLVSRKCDVVMNENEMAKLTVKAQDAVWEKVHEIIGPYVNT